MNYISDDPIFDVMDDKLNRAFFASSLANAIQNSPFDSGYVIALNGKWGSGKTSVLQLCKKELLNANVNILEFDPWIYTGTNKILDEFMNKLTLLILTTKKLRFARIAYKMKSYSLMISKTNANQVQLKIPLISEVYGAINWLIRIIKTHIFRIKTAEETKLHIHKLLRKSEIKIVVFIDDIDRLQNDEIQQITRMIKLVANFPQIIYVLAFDREIVGHALNLNNRSGEEYLGKIVQQSIDIPEISTDLLRDYTTSALDSLLHDFSGLVEFDSSRWSNIYWDIVSPNISSVRNVKRLLNAVRFACSNYGTKINVVDLIALESIRLFKIDLFNALILAKNFMHSPRYGIMYLTDNAEIEIEKQKLLSFFANGDIEFVKSVLRLLFPATESIMQRMHFGQDPQPEWLVNKRVASVELFDLYVTNTASKSLENKECAKELFALHTKAQEFRNYLLKFDGLNLTDIVDNLSMFKGKFSAASLPDVICSILDLIPRMSDAGAGIFTLNSTSIARKAILSSISGHTELDNIDVLMQTTYDRLTTLSEKNVLAYTIINSPEDVRISPDFRDKIKKQFEENVMETDYKQFLNETDFISILITVPKYLESNLNNVSFLMKVFKEAIGTGKSVEIGTRDVREFQMVSWPVLKSLFGSEDEVTLQLNRLLGEANLNSEDKVTLDWIMESRGKKDSILF